MGRTSEFMPSATKQKEKKNTQDDADFETRLILQRLSQLAQKKRFFATFRKHAMEVLLLLVMVDVELRFRIYNESGDNACEITYDALVLRINGPKAPV